MRGCMGRDSVMHGTACGVFWMGEIADLMCEEMEPERLAARNGHGYGLAQQLGRVLGVRVS